MLKFFKKYFRLIAVLSFLFLIGIYFFLNTEENETQEIKLGLAKKRSFSVVVPCTGELDAMCSTTIISHLRGDLAKLIELIPDGSTVQTGDVIARVDPTPFEERVNDLSAKTKDQQLVIRGLEKALERENLQAEHEDECSQFEVEFSQLDLEKVVDGEGPLEKSRLNSAMLKAKSKYEEILGYLEELENLQTEGFSTPGEISQVKKQIEEEWETFICAKQQYENYINYIFPSLVKRANLSLKRSISKQQDTKKFGQYRIANAKVSVDQSREYLTRLLNELSFATSDLNQTAFLAPTPGLVVHRLEFRGDKKRKPMLGDMLLKNQPLLEIPNLSDMIVRLKIRELDLHKVDIGKDASVEIDAFPGKVYRGSISHIGILAQSDFSGQCREKCFELIVKLSDIDKKLRPGMTARVTIHSNSFNDVLSIPAHAVFTQDRKYYCYASDGKDCEKREIELVPGDDQFAIVTSGLNEGDKVLLYLPKNEQ